MFVTSHTFVDTFAVRIDRDESFFDESPLPPARFDLSGVLGRFRDDAQLFPFFEDELDDVTAVEENLVVIPDRFVLHGNYPNPFNPSTTIRFDLPTNADVRIVIFDILGRQVLTIENNNVSAGSALTIEINASELSSGLYFYQLIAKLKEKTEIKTGKMTLLK